MLNIHWLLTGEGDMVNGERNSEQVELNEPTVPYRKGSPGENLRLLLDGYDKRIEDLETELRLLKDMEAEVHRLRGLVEGLLKGGVVKE